MPSYSFDTHRATAAFTLVAALALSACGPKPPEDILASGQAFAAQADHPAAIIQFKTALQAGLDTPQVRFALGRSLLETGDAVAATVELNKALEGGHPKDDVLPLLARALLLTGEHRKLTTAFGAVELANPTAAASLNTSLALAWIAQGDQTRGEAAAAKALAAVPDFGPAVVINARLLAGRNQFDSALALIDQVLKRDPKAFEALHLKGEILAFGRADPVAATEALRQALAISNSHAPSHSLLIDLALRANDLPAASAQLEKFQAALPRHPQTLFMEGQVAFQAGDMDKARDRTQQLLKFASDNVSVLQLAGAVEGRSGSLVVAESHFLKALQSNPELTQARRGLAVVYLRMGQANKALDTLRPMIGEGASDPAALALAGEAALATNDPAAAEALFTRAGKAAPNNPRIQTALAVTQLSRGNSERALAELRSLSTSSPDTVADMALFSTHIKNKDWAAALASLEVMSKKEPKSSTVAELRGRVHLMQRNIPAARAAYEQALALAPTMFEATARLAAIDMLDNKPAAARERLETAVRNDPRNQFAAVSLAQLLADTGASLDEQRAVLATTIQANPSEPLARVALVQLLLGNKRFKDALAAAQDAAAAAPSDLMIMDVLGRAQTQSGDLQQAISTFKRMVSLDPKSVVPHMRLAELYKNNGDRKSAEASLRRATEIESTAEAANAYLIDLMLSDKRQGEALAVARGLQQKKPSSASGHLLEGNFHHHQGDHNAAIAAYRAGLKREPERADVTLRLHQSLIAAGRASEADRLAADWMKDRPSDMAFAYQVALTSIARGDLARAEPWLRTVVERQPTNVAALNNLAFVMVSLGKSGALPFAERANAALPGRPAVMDTLALAMAAENQVPAALELQKKAVALAPDEPGYRLSLARIALKAGDKALARTELEALAKRGQQFPAHEEVSKLLKTL